MPDGKRIHFNLERHQDASSHCPMRRLNGNGHGGSERFKCGWQGLERGSKRSVKCKADQELRRLVTKKELREQTKRTKGCMERNCTKSILKVYFYNVHSWVQNSCYFLYTFSIKKYLFKGNIIYLKSTLNILQVYLQYIALHDFKYAFSTFFCILKIIWFFSEGS